MSKENVETLNILVQNIYDAIDNATYFADEHELDFRLDVEYGMGGSYRGHLEEGEWYPSSQNC